MGRIENKQKPCKGTGAYKHIDGGGKMTYFREKGLCANCLGDFLFGCDEGKDIYNKNIIPKAKANVKKEQRKKDRQKRQELKTLPELKKELQTQINHIVRLVDKGHPCIATGSYNGKMNAGHYFSVGSNDTLRFHLENIFIQSEHSNCYKSGDTLNYQDGIIKTFGPAYLDHMNRLKQTPIIKLNKQEVRELIKQARAIVKELKAKDKVYTNDERIELRKYYNKQLNIY